MSIFFSFFRRKRMERDAAEEIESHLQEKAAELEESGMPRELAGQQARRDFGNPTILTEDSRAVWRWPAWDHLRQDLRFACRWMRKSPVLPPSPSFRSVLE
jgi:hypothetical protein